MHTQKLNAVTEPSTAPVDKFQQAFQLHQQGQLEHAERLYAELLKDQPQHIDALHFSGVLAHQQGQAQRAVDLISLAIELAPNNAAAHSNLGLALQALRRFDEALASYDRALAIKPNNAEAFCNRGLVLKDLNRLNEALDSYEHILAINPNHAEALGGRGVILQDLKRHHEALISYERALAIKPDLEFFFGTWLSLKMQLCEWSDFDNHLNTLTKGIERGEKIATPFAILAPCSSAALQKKTACCYVQTKYASRLLLPPLVKHAHQKIRIGYFSSDFRRHPVAYLTAELFERHDRSRFEIIAFSFSPAIDKDDMRLRLEAAFDQFIDVSQQSDEQVVRLARELEIDIAVDLNGFTENCRTSIFAMRVAPIQVNYLGYSGTMGAEYIDYLLADSVLIPAEYQPYYTEKVVYLPNSYMVNDSTRPISNREFTRAELGLPEQGFVFCCFNNAYKITPTIFNVWMRLLHQVEGSVLWLSEHNTDAVNNLRQEASKRGIVADRLIFANRLPLLSEHLTRHRLADLFLDTLPYNAHTTTSDALWAGLPVLTLIGETFAGRVAASLLHAIGLPELITTTLKDYEALAHKLATHPEQLRAIKQKLADNRLTYPLFNTVLFTQHIESAFQAMFDRYQAGLAPDHITVSDCSTDTSPATLPRQSEKTMLIASFQQAFALHQQGQLEQAELLYAELLKAQPQHINALHFSGVLAHQQGQAQRAVDLISLAIELAPNNAAAHSNLGLVLQALKRFDEALASYDRALAIKLTNAEAFCNRGNTLLALKRFDEALASYDHALAIKPDYIEALSSRGMVLKDLNRLIEALDNYEHILAIQPDCAEALVGCGVILQDFKRYNEAIISYDRALAIKSDLDFVLGTRLHLKMNMCTWNDFDYYLDKLEKSIEWNEKVIIPFSALAMFSSAALQKKAAETYTEATHPSNFLLPPLVKHTHSKIKLAYFSADFRHHPVAYLAAELFERHDRSQFEVIAFSLHVANHKDDMRLRLEAGFDQFIDVSEHSDEQIVRLARELEIDIAVDLTGCTESGRTGIFAMRAAPIQVSYLGYLGTMGADYIDYLLADSTLIPVEHQAYYSEKIAYLPQCFQVNDSKLPIADKIVTRAELDLPEQGFVFCCFNNNFKITPVVFASWMSILQQVEGSVLWLLGDNDTAVKNLRLAAIEHGIAAERVVFAKRLPMPEYLARHRAADLFLDTSPYNAGATASAALWAGLPILTCLGDTFAGRMAASLLYAIGLPELVTKTPEEYEALAVQLATHPKQLAAIKQKLADNRLTYPLFNTVLFTQHIESVFQTMFNRYQAGLAPDHIYVSAHAGSPADTALKKPANRFNPLNLFGKIAALTSSRKNKTPTPQTEVALLTQADVDTFEQARRLHRRGQLVAAEILFEALLKTQPHHAETLRCLATLKKQRGQVDLTSQALNIKPAHLDAARTYDDDAPVIDTETVEALINQGNELEDLNRLDEALASYDRALLINPDYARAHSNRGNVLQSLKRFDEALASYDCALAIRPDYAEAFYNRGNTLQACHRIQEAIENYDRALAIKPDFILALISRGNALHDCNRSADALISYERALAIQPDYVEALYNQGRVLQDLHRYDEALVSYQRAFTIKPDYADAQLGSSWCYLLLGDFDRGWEKYEWRWKTDDFKNNVRNFSQPPWFGVASLQGKTILLHSEQGLGDTLHFCRYAKQVADLGARVILEVPKPLLRLLANLEGVNQLVARGSVLPDFDFHCPLLSLPLAFKTRLDSIPANTPYLFSEPNKVKHWQTLLGEKTLPRVGLVWSGNAAQKNDQYRSLPLHELLPLLTLPYQFISLQKELRDTDKELLAQQPNLQDYSEQINDFTDTAALCELMDVVISVCTSVAHLSAAMGKPTWILLSDKACWRWLIDRCDSPWYPTVRLFRQNQHGDWQDVIKRLKHELIDIPAQNINPTIEFQQPSETSATTTADFQQALSLHQRGQLAAAEALYEEILQVQPQHVDVLHFLGVLKNQNGQAQRAVDLIQQSLNLYPDNAAAHSNLGMVLQTLNRFDEALISYDQALAIKPDAIKTLLERGLVLQALNRFDEALINYEQLLAIDPTHAEALFGHANVLYSLKRPQEALISYDRSLAINPDSFETLYNRGVALADLNRVDEAISSYQQAVVLKPDYAEAHNNLATLFKKQNRFIEAQTSYQNAIAVKPNYTAAHCNLITLLIEQGQLSVAKNSLNTALGAIPDSVNLRFIQLIMTLPIITKTAAESALVPHQFDATLTDLSTWLASSPIHQESLTKAGLLPLPFLIAYRAGNHVQRLSRYGDLVADTTKPANLVKPPRKKIRMIVISHHFRRHSVWDVITRGLLANLDRTRFELILYHLGNIEDQETAFAKSLADEWRDTGMMMDETDWLTALATDAPDVIFYPEIGMDPMSAKLARYRLAPLQMASWGHPITTGLPTIDLYFSGELLESPDADNHYRERLIRLPSTGCCTTPIPVTPEPLYELEAQLATRQGVLFIIAQTIYKFEPADDTLYANIASIVGASTFILLRDRNNAWAMDQILTRLEQAFIDRGLNPQQHLLVIPWQSVEKFQSLLDLCDVYLDCPSFSGYTTAWQAVHRGLPIVTLEGEFMRQRLAAGLLRKIGITDTIASSREAYVQLAAKLAKECLNPTQRSARRHALKTAAPKADNDVSVVRAFEQSVIKALAERSSNL